MFCFNCVKKNFLHVSCYCQGWDLGAGLGPGAAGGRRAPWEVGCCGRTCIYHITCKQCKQLCNYHQRTRRIWLLWRVCSARVRQCMDNATYKRMPSLYHEPAMCYVISIISKQCKHAMDVNNVLIISSSTTSLRIYLLTPLSQGRGTSSIAS